MKSSLSCSVKSQQLKIHLVAGMKHLFWKWWWEGGADLSVILTSKKKKKGGGETTSIFKILIRTGGGNLRLIFLVKFKISYQLRKKGGGGSSEKIFVFVI